MTTDNISGVSVDLLMEIKIIGLRRVGNGGGSTLLVFMNISRTGEYFMKKVTEKIFSKRDLLTLMIMTISSVA